MHAPDLSLRQVADAFGQAPRDGYRPARANAARGKTAIGNPVAAALAAGTELHMTNLAITLWVTIGALSCSASAPRTNSPASGRTWCDPTDGDAVCGPEALCPRVADPCSVDESWPQGQHGFCTHSSDGDCTCRALCQAATRAPS